MSGRRLLLLRHGRTAHNAAGIFQGRLDPPLDEVGQAQARAAAEAIADLKPTALVSSSAIRARATAETVAERCGLQLSTDDRLFEVDTGVWSGMPAKEVAEQFPEDYAGWVRGDDVRLGGGESYSEAAERAYRAVCEALDTQLGDAAGLLVVVTHGGIARGVSGRMLGLPFEHWRALAALSNCAYTLLSEGAHRWVLVQHGVSPTPDGGR